MGERESRLWTAGETALALVFAAGFLACVGGPGNRDREVEGNWSGPVEEKSREVTHDLRLEIDRSDEDEDDLTARVTLNGESAEAWRVRSGSRRTVRIWYELPSGRKGRVRGRVTDTGWTLRGALRIEEDGKAYGSRFEIPYEIGTAVAEAVLAAEPESPPPVSLPDAPDPERYGGSFDPGAPAPEGASPDGDPDAPR